MPRDSLETVYRLIASNRYLEAMHLINKIIKKQPNYTIAKVWKCEALYGLGNVAESEELMGDLMVQNHDKRTLDSIADYFRARGNYTKLIEVYENALKTDPSDDDWRKALFECCGLAGDYKKQQQQALILNKQSPRMLFYCMAVVCMMQQADENPVALELAERMMMKQLDAGKLKSRNEILLLINVLEMRGKLEEALSLLDKSATDLDALISSADKRIYLLAKLERWSESALELKQYLKDKPDNWAYYKQYITAVLKLEAAGGTADDPNVEDSPERAKAFLTALREEHSNLRGPFLAAMELFKRTTTEESSKAELCDLIVNYFHRFGAKAICVFDLSQYITLVPESMASELLMKISVPGYNDIDCVDLQRSLGASKHVSFLQLSRLLGAQSSLSIEQREKLCLDLQKCYSSAEGCDRRDQYLLLMTQIRFSLFKDTRDVEHLILTACELEDASALGTVFAVQVLLLQIYFALGASKAARKIYEQLRIQSVQVDTLVHLFLASISSTGHFTIASEMWELSLKTLQQCSAESLEALVWCYRAGLFHRVEEFTQCARRFQRTITVPLLRGEKAYLDLVSCEPSRIEQLLARVPPPVAWDTCVDNRDMRALPSWDPPSSHQRPDLSYGELVLFCKIRESTLSCVAAAVAFGKQRKEEEEKAFLAALDNVQALYAEGVACSSQGRENSAFNATRLHQIVQAPLPSLLEKILEVDLASTEKICTMLKLTTETCLSVVAENNTKNPRLSLEAFVTQLEMLAIVTVTLSGSRGRMAPVQRRRSEQVARTLETCFTDLEASLPAVRTTEPSWASATRKAVGAKLKDSYLAAADDLRKVIRRKVACIHKIKLANI